MIFIYLLTTFLFGQLSMARVDAKFLGFVGLLTITDRVLGQVTDEDPARLYDAMNVEPKNEGGRLGKAIEVGKKKFTMVCGEKLKGEMVCTLVIKAGPQGTVDAVHSRMRFVALGKEAADLQKLFFLNEQGFAQYRTDDETVSLRADPDSFVVEYAKR